MFDWILFWMLLGAFGLLVLTSISLVKGMEEDK